MILIIDMNLKVFESENEEYWIVVECPFSVPYQSGSKNLTILTYSAAYSM